jgi:hypothetical protein
LTLAADAAALEGTPETEDEARRYEAGGGDEDPGVVVMGGMGGMPIPVPTETIDPALDQPPRD